MNTYIFYYCTDYESYKKLDYLEYPVNAPRFYQAFRTFVNFLKTNPSDYISYLSCYRVIGQTKQNSLRVYKESDLIKLANVKDKHNVRFYEDFNDEIY